MKKTVTRIFPARTIAALVCLAGMQTLNADSVPVPVVNPSFEQPAVAVGATSSSIPGWICNSCGVFRPAGFPHPTNGSQVAVLNFVYYDKRWQVSGVIQEFTTLYTAGATYTVQLDVTAGPVSLSGVVDFLVDNVAYQANGPSSVSVHLAPGETKHVMFNTPYLPDFFVGHNLGIMLSLDNKDQVAGGVGAYVDNVQVDLFRPPPYLRGSFGLGSISIETPRLKAYCDASTTQSACDVTLQFTDLQGAVLGQSTLTLQPGASGFFDLPNKRGAGVPIGIVPGFKIARGTAVVSLELLDPATQRTQLLVDWGAGSRARTGDVEFGLAGLTASDSGRLGAFCPGDGPSPQSCNVVFEFHDSQGRLVKQSRSTLAPGTAASLDLSYREAIGVGGRVEMEPGLQVTGGPVIATFAVVDSSTGRTLAHVGPAASASLLAPTPQ